MYFAENMLKTKGESFKGKTVAVSGSGNVAQFATEKVIQLGGKVVTMSDSSGSIYDKEGIDNKKLQWIMDLKNIRRGRMKEYTDEFGGEYWDGKRPWGAKCDVTLPSATQNEINKEDAQTLVKNGCICVAEGANMPSEAEAINVFLENKILFGPGKAANAGGVAVSGLEMSQNAMSIRWSREEVDKKLQDIMSNIHEACVSFGKEGDFTNYVKGANIAGFIKVADAMMDQGVV